MSNRKLRAAAGGVDAFEGVEPREPVFLRWQRYGEITRKVLVGAVLVGIALCVVVWLTGCSSVQAEYVKADRATFNAIGPEHKKLVREAYRRAPDGKFERWFDDEQAARRELLVDSWDLRTSRGETDGR